MAVVFGSIRLRGILALTLLVLLATAAQAQAAPDRSVDRQNAGTSEWDGPTQTAANQNFDQDNGGPCGKDADNYCDITLVNVGVKDDAYYANHQASLKIDVGGFNPPTQDFDLYVYESDAAGNRGAFVDSSGNPPGLDETLTINKPSGYYLVIVPYFLTSGTYHGKAALTVTDTAKPPLPDVDSPPGVATASLASNPAFGFRSHSEPHIAQSPTNPNILIAGSKMYNKDRDSLKEYEFKIGTYVSFDRGRTWTDLGQMNLCPSASDAPPTSWPDNTCYPADDPNVGGNGPEDAKDNRGHTDYGEEYITSDIWMQFDDEGNAYAMVLDSPPFTDGAGWAMSFHKWVTPTPQDVVSGNTWGKKVVINNYPDEKGNTGKGPDGTTNAPDQAKNPGGFLDDKNTFAIDNTGADGDGKTGTILACWGQNISTAIKQQTVCERSTDAGKSFPDPPKPVSGEQQLVLGVNALADPSQPDTFYVIWKGYTTAVAGGIVFPQVGEGNEDDLGTGLGTHPAQVYISKTADGGQTYTPARPIATFNDLASPLPGSNFRTGSIPIAAAAPNGDVYVVFDAYNDAPDPAHDADGKTADVQMIKSTDGGVTFSNPVVVNQDKSNADQFQSHVAVNPEGQVNVAFFDRRNDPANFYIDEYLAQSGDGGKSFTETRLSHDMFDAAINAPISTSGEFFGDYQGLVADRCQALAFYQDTHLANDPSRDPNFDSGAPRSPFQEVFAYRAEAAGRQSDPGCAKPAPVDQGVPFVNPGGKPCTPAPPGSSIDRKSIRARRGAFRMAGLSTDFACRGKRPLGKVKRVEVALGKKTGNTCRFFLGKGKFTKQRRCSTPVFVGARLKRPGAGKSSWTFSASRGFGPGLYLLRVRGVDSNRYLETRVTTANSRVVRVRR